MARWLRLAWLGVRAELQLDVVARWWAKRRADPFKAYEAELDAASEALAHLDGYSFEIAFEKARDVAGKRLNLAVPSKPWNRNNG